MKFVRIAALCMALLLALSACGGGDGGSSSSALTLAEGSDPVVNGSSVSSTLADEGQESGPEVRHMMTVDEVLVFFSGLSPQELGLERESMSDYNFYPSEKAIPVNNLPSMKIIVYQETETNTNEPVATFLIARDGTAVYRLEDGELTQVYGS